MLQGSVGIKEKRSGRYDPSRIRQHLQIGDLLPPPFPGASLMTWFFVCDALKWPTKCLHSDNQLPGILIESRLEVRSLHFVYNIWVFPKIGGPPKNGRFITGNPY